MSSYEIDHFPSGAEMIRVLSKLQSDTRGSVIVIAAASLLVLLASTALAVDIGSAYLADRRLQGVADAAALAAVDAPTGEMQASQKAATANGLASEVVSSVTPGVYTPDATITPAQRFSPGGTGDNASRVILTQDVPIYFGSIITHSSTIRIQVAATAARIDYAAFSIGTRLAAIQGGLPNALLSGLIGTNLNLSVMDYNSLVGAHVNLLSFSKALATELNLTGASFGTTLATQATLPQILNALAAAAPDSASATAYRNLALTVPSTAVRLSDLIDLGPYADTDEVDPNTVVTMNGYSIVQEMLQLANGQRQVAINLGLSLPGITSTKLTVAIGQRPAHSPWLAIAKDGSVIVQTAQMRLYLDSTVGGAGTLGLVSLRLPLYIQLAAAQAKLDSLSCSGGSGPTATLLVEPSVGNIAIADLDMSAFSNFGAAPMESAAVIAQAPLVSVTGRADVALGGVTWQRVSFSASEIAAGTTKTVSTGDLTQGVATSLVGNMKLQANALGLGINLSGVTSSVGAVLTPLAPTLDALIDQVTALLGVHLGQADVTIDGVRCGKPTLVG